MFNPDKYRSVSWLKGGRAHPKLDCFGIVNEIRRDLELPTYPDFAGVTKDNDGLDRAAKGYLSKMTRSAPEPGALALWRRSAAKAATGALLFRTDCESRRDRYQY